MNLGTTRLRGRPRNRWQDEVREGGRIIGGEGWQEKIHNREEWKKLLRTARNRRILHVPMNWMNEWIWKLYFTLKALQPLVRVHDATFKKVIPLAEAVIGHPVTTENRYWSQASPCEICCWQISNSLNIFSFYWSVSFFQCPVFVHSSIVSTAWS